MIDGKAARMLTSTIRKERDEAMLIMFKKLDKTKKYNDNEWQDFFKVIFYHFWLSDKQYVQHHLADYLSEQLLSEPIFSLAYLHHFWDTMRKEWHNLDNYRLDKYYDLIRRVHMNTFKFLHLQKFDIDTVEAVMSILRSEVGPLCNDSLDFPNSLRFHSLEAIIDEFCKSCSENEEIDSFPQALLNEDILKHMTRPFLDLFNNSQDKAILEKIKEEVFEKLINLLQQVEIGEKSLQYLVNMIYSYPTHVKMAENKREMLFNLVKTTKMVPEFISMEIAKETIPELVNEYDASTIVAEYDMDLGHSQEERVFDGNRIQKIREVRTLWRVSPKSDSSLVISDIYYPVEASFAIVPKENFKIPKLDALNKCKHKRTVHFKLQHNKIKHFQKRHPPSYIGNK